LVKRHDLGNAQDRAGLGCLPMTSALRDKVLGGQRECWGSKVYTYWAESQQMPQRTRGLRYNFVQFINNEPIPWAAL
jgi:hypothetical protein